MVPIFLCYSVFLGVTLCRFLEVPKFFDELFDNFFDVFFDNFFDIFFYKFFGDLFDDFFDKFFDDMYLFLKNSLNPTPIPPAQTYIIKYRGICI